MDRGFFKKGVFFMECNSAIKNRLKRAQGQMRGVLSMMENDASCSDLTTQLKAIRSSIDKTIHLLTTENLIHTIEESLNVKIDNVEEAIDLILKGK